MKTKILLCVFTWCGLSAFGQPTDIAGTYYSQLGQQIQINQDKLYLLMPQSHLPVWYSDTLAICTFKWIGDNFIELNSTPPYSTAFKNLRISRAWDSTIRDSIKISFILPCQKYEKLNIVVYTDTFQTFKLSYTDNNRDLMLPKESKTIHFTISPDSLIPHTADGSFYGIITFDSIQTYPIGANENHLTIEIPAMNGSFLKDIM